MRFYYEITKEQRDQIEGFDLSNYPNVVPEIITTEEDKLILVTVGYEPECGKFEKDVLNGFGIKGPFRFDM